MNNPPHPDKNTPARALFFGSGHNFEEQREDLLSIPDRFVVGYTEVDAGGRIVYMSKGICRELGFTEEEVIGKNISGVFFSDEANGQRDMIRDLSNQAGRVPFTCEMEFTLHDGSSRWIRTSAVNRFDETNNYAGMMAIHIDITDLRSMLLELSAARQAAGDAQRAQQQFLASMSHEIRSPLNTIIGMSYLLPDTRLDPGQDEYVKILKNASNILLELINDILDLAKIESGKADIKIREFDLNGLINTLKYTFRHKLRNKPVKIVSETKKEDKEETVFEGGKLLIVEDNPMNLKYLSSLMEKFHIRYVVATNGNEALKKAQEELFDLMLMDIRIPGIEGLEVTRKIRNEENPNRATPIVILTTAALAGTIAAAQDAGVNDLLTKPYTPDQLLYLLKKYLLEDPELNEEQETPAGFEFDSRLDTAYLWKLYRDNFEYAYDLFQLFTGCIEKELTEIRLSMQRQDWEKMQALIHKVKPNFSMVGLSWITRSMQEVYDNLRAKNYDRIGHMMLEIMNGLDAYLPLVREEQKRLEAFLKSIQDIPHSA